MELINVEKWKDFQENVCEWYERGFGFEGSFEGGRKQICFYVFFWGVGGGKGRGG